VTQSEIHLRDTIALAAMEAGLASLTALAGKELPLKLRGKPASEIRRELAEGSYAMADAMMKARVQNA